MNTIIMIAVFSFILVSVIGIAANRVSSLKVKVKEEEKKTATAEYKEKAIKKSIDNVLLFQSEDKDIQKVTQEHVNILVKTRSKGNVEKELSILRDSIYADYNKLRND